MGELALLLPVVISVLATEKTSIFRAVDLSPLHKVRPNVPFPGVFRRTRLGSKLQVESQRNYVLL